MTTGDGAHDDPKLGILELALYAPVGLMSVVAEQVPQVVERGRARVDQRVTLARFVGQLAVTQARLQIERRCASLGEAGASEPQPVTPAAAPTGSDDGAGADVTQVAGSRSGVVADTDDFTGSGRAVGEIEVPSVDELPIEGYEHLPASHVISLLPELLPDELDLVETFERAHRNRRTILGRVAQLRRSA